MSRREYRGESGKWYFGEVITLDYTVYIATKGDDAYIDKDNIIRPIDGDYIVVGCHKVMEDTISEDTGIVGRYKGKSKKIFEGDIVKGVDGDGNELLGTVVFDNGAFSVDASVVFKEKYLPPLFSLVNVEIVGNTWDNHEEISK